jgi:hypothetical protein
MKVTLTTLKLNQKTRAFEQVAVAQYKVGSIEDAKRFLVSYCYANIDGQWQKRHITRQGEYLLRAEVVPV